MIKKLLLNTVGISNIMYLRSLFISQKEKEMIEKRKNFYLQFLNSGDTYYDVGANYGNRIYPIINSGINIIAVEPQYECLKYLKRKFGNKIKLVPMGLGPKVEEKTMFISDAHTISTFSEDFIESTKKSGRFSMYNWNVKRQIKMTTLDNLIAEFGLPRFIKIDVEGFEIEVLKGLTHPIDTISYEYAVPEQTDKAVLCLQRIMEISNNKVSCNYSIGESMKWALTEWLTPEQMIAEITSQKFTDTGFGDIYIKYNK